MSVFDVDISAMVTQNLPTRMRQPVMTAWLNCLATPCIYLKGLFDANRATNLYYTGHNGQVCYLEAALNDVFDPGAHRLYIADPPYLDDLVLFLQSEIPPEAAIPLYLVSETVPTGARPLLPLFLNSEVGEDDNCFVVQYPTVLALTTDQLARLRALVDTYRLPGKNNYSVAPF